MHIGLYIISVILSYLMFRKGLINEGNDAQYYPHFGLFIVMLIPLINMAVSLIFLLLSCEFIHDYKKFWRIK